MEGEEGPRQGPAEAGREADITLRPSRDGFTAMLDNLTI